MKVHRRLLDTVPRYAEARSRIEERAFRAERGMVASRTGCTKIPVVVHVVHKAPGQDISQAQIDSQIRVLNEDFRKRNPDVGTVPAQFAPLAADARVEFELATTDPDGNPTNGVDRKPTKVDAFADDDAVKFDSSGGADAWPSDRYLNIWVCQLGGGLLGYAQFPGGPPETDGVVVLHSAFGTTGTAAPPFDRGRTTTHEVGHWLDLRHIWGDDGEGCSGSDFVGDTPNQGGPNFGAPAFPTVSCSNGPDGDMFMNYMDYVDDVAMMMFTQGQATRMQAALDGPRSTIGTSISCGPTSPPRDLAKPIPKDIVKELPKEFPKDFPKEPPKDFPKDIVKEFPKDPPKEFPKDPPKEIFKDPPKDPPKEFAKDPPKEPPKDPPKDFPKDFTKDPPKDFGKDFGKDPPKDFPKDFGKDPPKDFGKDFGKDFPNDPPKTFLEPPIDFPAPPFQPGPGGGPMPFVLATPAAAAAGAGRDAARQQTAAACGQLLMQYAQLHARGMLDAQGLAAWRQAWATYQQLVVGGP